MKRTTIFLALSLVLSLTTGCGNTGNSTNTLKVGQITDTYGVNDRSFNQAGWEGITNTIEERMYLIPYASSTEDFLREVTNLYELGYNVLVATGFQFEEAMYEAQALYPDLKIILIDGTPHGGDYNYVVGENTMCIYFAEHESGFLAGIATALKIQEGEVGFIGGVEIPAVQKFNWGFQQGIEYANTNLGTSIEMKPEHFVYINSFYDIDAAASEATRMYDAGVNAIFTAASAAGNGAIIEAQRRTLSGEECWVIGVDVDNYEDGIYDNGKSVILTSAMKFVADAVSSSIMDIQNNAFKGGEILTLTASENMVGIPENNPNLSADIYTQVHGIQQDIMSGKIIVESTNDNGKYYK